MIELEIAKVLKLHTDIICNRVRAKWGNMVGIVGNAEIHSDFPKIVGSMVVASIEASGQKAWIAEFGSGSLSAPRSENPYLGDYVSHGNFNRHRSEGNMSIKGRDKGSYYDLDGYKHESTGRSAGKDLELKPVYTVMYPAHVIQHEVTTELPEIIVHLQQVIEASVLAELTMDVQIYI